MSELTKSSYVILGLLSKSPHSGYELKRVIARASAASSFYWSESNAQIYPVLKKLEGQGLVNSAIDAASGARNKRVYTITKKGQTELMQWLKKDCELAVYREEFLLQLSLAQHLTAEELLNKLRFYKQSIAHKLTLLESIIDHIQVDHAGRADQRFLLLTYDHIKAMLEAKLQWCEKTLKNLAVD